MQKYWLVLRNPAMTSVIIVLRTRVGKKGLLYTRAQAILSAGVDAIHSLYIA